MSRRRLSVKSYMRFYVADYLGDTNRLTTEQHGAYLLLLFEAWLNGPLPTDPAALARITRMTLRTWRARCEAEVMRFFILSPEGWVQERLEAERLRAINVSEELARGGRAGALKANQKTKPQAVDNAQSVSRHEAARPPEAERPGRPYPEPKEDSSLRSESSPAHAPAVRKRADEPLPMVDLPDWLPADAWAAWCAYRLKRNRKAWTQHAAELGLRELAKLRADGNDPREVIEQSIASGWTGLFALKGGRSTPLFNGGPHERNDRPAERRAYGAGGAGEGFRAAVAAIPELAGRLEGD